MMTMVVVSCRSVMRASDDDKSINIIIVEAAAAAAAPAGYDEEDIDDATNKKMRCLHVCSYYLDVLFYCTV